MAKPCEKLAVFTRGFYKVPVGGGTLKKFTTPYTGCSGLPKGQDSLHARGCDVLDAEHGFVHIYALLTPDKLSVQ